jgi:hypothetical protein
VERVVLHPFFHLYVASDDPSFFSSWCVYLSAPDRTSLVKTPLCVCVWCMVKSVSQIYQSNPSVKSISHICHSHLSVISISQICQSNLSVKSVSQMYQGLGVQVQGCRAQGGVRTLKLTHIYLSVKSVKSVISIGE